MSNEKLPRKVLRRIRKYKPTYRIRKPTHIQRDYKPLSSTDPWDWYVYIYIYILTVYYLKDEKFM